MLSDLEQVRCCILELGQVNTSRESAQHFLDSFPLGLHIYIIFLKSPCSISTVTLCVHEHNKTARYHLTIVFKARAQRQLNCGDCISPHAARLQPAWDLKV